MVHLSEPTFYLLLSARLVARLRQCLKLEVLDTPNRAPIRLEQGYQKLRYVLNERFHIFS